VNHKIRVPEVRLIGANGEPIGIVTTREAMDEARKHEMDLVEIAPAAKPPVCRVMDYGKYKYEQGKKQKASNRSQSQTKMKEIKYHANVGEHDYQTKLRRAREFLEEGHRVKCSLYFRGRENDHREFGFQVFQRVQKDVIDIAEAEQQPRLMGRSLFMLLSPNAKTRAQARAKKEQPAASEKNPPEGD
jgi:translation initiation factor IF-3